MRTLLLRSVFVAALVAASSMGYLPKAHAQQEAAMFCADATVTTTRGICTPDIQYEYYSPGSLFWTVTGPATISNVAGSNTSKYFVCRKDLLPLVWDDYYGRYAQAAAEVNITAYWYEQYGQSVEMIASAAIVCYGDAPKWDGGPSETTAEAPDVGEDAPEDGPRYVYVPVNHNYPYTGEVWCWLYQALGGTCGGWTFTDSWHSEGFYIIAE